MQITAQKLFKELETGTLRPLYLVVGEEWFQISEILGRIRRSVVADESLADFQCESWDGEGLDGGALKSSLEELPGLFSAGGPRLIICRNFEKASAGALEIIESYFSDPLDSTVFVMVANKVDKRKSWFRSFDQKGAILEVHEPQDREWPKWLGFMEQKVGKSIEAEAWERLVAISHKRLAFLWSELQKVAIFVNGKPAIQGSDVALLAAGEAGEDIFLFAEDVISRRVETSFRQFHGLVKQGESEIKILAILVRQFRIVQQYKSAIKNGVSDPKVVGPQIGVHPFFVSKVASQAKHHDEKSLQVAIRYLAEADYRLKTGGGGVFENFLVPYFGAQHRLESQAVPLRATSVPNPPVR